MTARMIISFSCVTLYHQTGRKETQGRLHLDHL